MEEQGLRDKELSLVLVDNKTIRDLNKTYLGRDNITNVIAFPLTEGQFSNMNPLLGDIVISVEKAREDAQAEGLGLEEEIFFLLIHGLLHLTGFNHENTTEEQAAIMKRKEQELFLKLAGIAIE